LPDGGFDEVRPATLNSDRCFWHFNRSGIGPHTACTGTPGAGSAAGAGPASATASNSIDIVSDVHGLLGRLRYPSYELPKRLCCCRTYHGHPESRWQFALHSQLHDPTARLQTGVHQAAGAVNCHVPGPISRLAILLAPHPAGVSQSWLHSDRLPARASNGVRRGPGLIVLRRSMKNRTIGGVRWGSRHGDTGQSAKQDR
jgi:hypothetical protein